MIFEFLITYFLTYGVFPLISALSFLVDELLIPDFLPQLASALADIGYYLSEASFFLPVETFAYVLSVYLTVQIFMGTLEFVFRVVRG